MVKTVHTCTNLCRPSCFLEKRSWWEHRESDRTSCPTPRSCALFNWCLQKLLEREIRNSCREIVCDCFLISSEHYVVVVGTVDGQITCISASSFFLFLFLFFSSLSFFGINWQGPCVKHIMTRCAQKGSQMPEIVGLAGVLVNQDNDERLSGSPNSAHTNNNFPAQYPPSKFGVPFKVLPGVITLCHWRQK